MGTSYSNTVTFSAVSGEQTCVELPLPPRGKLTRIVITQISGTAAGGTVNVYNRKSACENQDDLNVDESGEVDSISNNLGSVQLATVEDHNLQVGDEIEIINCSVSAYNVTHTVTEVVDATKVLTDISYTAPATDGIWQTLPLAPRVTPTSSLVVTGTMSAGSYQNFSVKAHYENKDNQSVTMRTRYPALWLGMTPDQDGDFEIAVSAEADSPS